MTTEPNVEEAEGNLATVLASGKVPLKLVTGRQDTTGLQFKLDPGAIVAHPNSTVLFVCG